MNTPRILRHALIAIAAAAVTAATTTARAQTKVLIDFGNNTTYGGVSTPGNWNSVAFGYVANMIDSTGAPTTIDWAPDGLGGTDSFNSIAGPTSNPPTAGEIAIADAAIDKPSLGDLGAAEAAIDYYVSDNGVTTSGRFQLQGLTPGVPYRLTFYGTKQFVAPGNEQTRYEVFSDAAYSASLGFGVLTTGTTNGTGNPGATVSVDITAPAATIFVEWVGVNNAAAGYLNAMSIAEVPFTPAAGRGVLLDFGNVDTFRGTSQTGADANGNHWNSVNNLAFWTNLVDTSNLPTGVNFGFTTVTGTDSYNGPAGPTTNPITPAQVDNVQVNSALLGPLGGSKAAAFDYYVSSTLQIQNLDPSKTYQVALFGSMKYPAAATTRYTLYTDGDFTNAVGAVDLDIGSGGNHNQMRVAVFNNVSPQSNGIIYLGFKAADGVNDGYLNSLMLVELAQTNLFLAWSGGQPATPALVGQYAFGGASAPNPNYAVPSVTALDATNMTQTLIVRTNDPSLAITGLATTNLAAGGWATNGVSFTPADQTGVPAGCERRIYSVGQGTAGKHFLLLEGVLTTP